MNLKREQEYIKKFIENMTDEEFEKAMAECGNEIILPTEDIYTALKNEGFYDSTLYQYTTKTNYVEPEDISRWRSFLTSDHGQGVAA